MQEREKQFPLKSFYYCSRSCANARVHSDETRNKLSIRNKGIKPHLNCTASSLRNREKWKYSKIERFLIAKGISYKFEFLLPDSKFIYDLALLDAKLLIEFDASYHTGRQLITDHEKERLAYNLGWKVVRIPTKTNHIFPAVIIKNLCQTL